MKPTVTDLLMAGKTLKETSRQRGVTRERVRQVAQQLVRQGVIQPPKDYRPRRK
jgi:hypothetical protein